MVVLSTVWWLFLLFIMYTLGWFLFSTFMFVCTKGQTPALKMTTAAVLGSFSALLHVVVCAVKSGVCG